MSLIRTYSKRAAKRKVETEEELDIPKKQRLELQPPTPTPPKLARDLSRIFDDATASLSSNKNHPPNKVARRMLGRSKTESYIASEPGTPSTSRIVDRTSSLPSFPSPSSSNHNASSHSLPPSPAKRSHTDVAPLTPSRRTTSLKRTYAGKSRTFLVALPVDPSSMTSLEQTLQEEEDEYMNRESYNSLRMRWGVDNSEDDPFGPTMESTVSSVNTTPRKGKAKVGKGKGGSEKTALPPDTIKPFKSITEIRNKGESRRFLDEVGYLLEGMDKEESPALRRTSALEITNRLCETEFARKAKAADFLLRTWEAFAEGRAGSGEDRVLDAIFAFFCALVARDTGSLSDLVERAHMPTGTYGESGRSPFITNLFSLLAIITPDRDPLHLISQSLILDGQLKKIGITKSDRILLKSLHDTILSKSQLFPLTHTVSTLSLVTHTLATIAPISLSPAYHLRPLLQSMRTQLIPLIINSSTPSNGVPRSTTGNLNSAVPDVHIRFGAFQDLLGMFDCYLLKRWSNDEAEDLGDLIGHAREEGWLPKGLIGLGVCAEAACANAAFSLNHPDVDDETSSADFASACKCIELAFRVLVSLTHADPDWSGSIVNDPVSLTFVIGQVCRADRVRLKNLRGTGNGKVGKGKEVVKKEQMTDSDNEEDLKAAVKGDGRRNVYSQVQALDRLCLALGLLTNIVQEVGVAKDRLRETSFDPKCIDQREPCISSCTCPNSVSILNILADVYHHQLARVRSTATTKLKRESSPSTPPPHDADAILQVKADVDSVEAEADASFLLGHLSVLFGLFMRDNPANQELIIAALPMEPSVPASNRRQIRRAKLDKMVQNAKALVKFYATINKGINEEGGDGTEDDEETGSLTGDARREVELGDITTGVNIAQGVVAFLEELRDD
ncbi:hypothetical protein E1B28_007856 [Marasmius oreades]|uniref:Wings apart-like protein C-terminal domain-containing protein n=1 Tax=Marasmius oreades TaxID=181124 RepID=A0A9P7S3W7_9AGAR|nr:uncharacterized protein E1B28_007856 [Marasmius oreades]KAG7094251.1 hypothetical protein E1B28_007856 [Marasmius oreades]